MIFQSWIKLYELIPYERVCLIYFVLVFLIMLIFHILYFLHKLRLSSFTLLAMLQTISFYVLRTIWVCKHEQHRPTFTKVQERRAVEKSQEEKFIF